jgi:hypothetical protein
LKNTVPVIALFVDIGGVLLNNGWDRVAGRKVAKRFNPRFGRIYRYPQPGDGPIREAWSLAGRNDHASQIVNGRV